MISFSSGEIDEQRRETYDIERSTSNMQNDMIKLNTLLNKEKGVHENLHQDNILLENDFIMALRVSFNSFKNHTYHIKKPILVDNTYLLLPFANFLVLPFLTNG